MLSAHYEKCPYCGSTSIDHGEYKIATASMLQEDKQQAHELRGAAGQELLQATRPFNRCLACGGTWSKETT